MRDATLGGLRAARALIDKAIRELEEAENRELGLPPLKLRRSLPSYCYDCGVYLQGGATVHKDTCWIKQAIDEAFSPAPRSRAGWTPEKREQLGSKIRATKARKKQEAQKKKDEHPRT